MTKPRLLSVLGLLVLLAVGCGSQPVRPAAATTPFSLVQLCDPQLGFTSYTADLQRLEEAVDQINSSHADFVVICGDLVNAANEKTFTDFLTAMKRLRVPYYCAPGNHDLGNVPTTASLERYRKFIGRDYYSFQHHDCTFVVANSQLWKSPVPGESEKHDAWFKATLETAARQRQPVFVICHYLPFEKEPHEPEGYYSLPAGKREELLGLFRRCGVVALLAGHTHKTMFLDYHGIQIVTSETTSRNFDQRPFGYRVWHVGATRPYRHEFVPLARQNF